MAMLREGAARRRHGIERLEQPEYGWIWKPLLVLLVIALLVAVALGIWWSRPPPTFDVEQATAERREEASPASRGAVTTATLITSLQTLRDKPGGYLRNDIAPPGVWLDNLPSWELGVLEASRDLAGTLPAMEAGEAPALDAAVERLARSHDDWFYPGTEHHLGEAVAALDDYLSALGEAGDAGFAEGAALSSWLERVAGRLDDLGRRLSASVGSRERLREAGIADDALPPPTPWYRVDDVFFEARGAAWALLHQLQAVQRDQADVIEGAGRLDDWSLLVAELERTQRRLWSPVVLNGSGFGIFANHSLVMANHLSRARDRARELALALETPPLANEEAASVAPRVEEVERSEAAPEGPDDEEQAEASGER
jgi:hypothetical protein